MRLAQIFQFVVVLCSVVTGSAHAGFVNGYLYTQTNGPGGLTAAYSNAPGTESTVADLNAPISISASGTMMTFEAKSKPVTSTDLHTYTRLSYATDSSTGLPESFHRIQATVYAEASFVDTATVMAPPGVTSGTLLFSWTLSGDSSYSANAPLGNMVGVDVLRADVKLESTIPGFEDIYQDSLVAPSLPWLNGGDTIQDMVTNTTGALLFPVAWSGSTTVPVEFVLQSSVQLDARALDATQFNATAESDHYNSAILNGVMILDEDGTVLGQASLESSNGFTYTTLTSVPEPSGFLLGSLSLGGILAIRFATKRFNCVR